MSETIIAQATPPGYGGVGILRISGPGSSQVATEVLGCQPRVRRAEYLPFLDEQGQMLDRGIALYFSAPHSFTGEDVLELQGHGGPVVLDLMMQRILKLPGVRAARPGEFSERAFLNDKMDLTQAEAIADLIEASSEQAARSALNSLQGEFSNKINHLVEQLTQLRIFVEAAIDFPEEEIDFLSDGKVSGDLDILLTQLTAISQEARQGSLMREGMKVVIAGRPNAGKSSLLNALAGKETAIVTDIAGTTRDVLREHIHIDGMPIHIIDTAGLRDSPDQVEQIGIERAWQAIREADMVLFLVDGSTTEVTDPHQLWPEFIDQLPMGIELTLVRNKVDLTQESLELGTHQGYHLLPISAKTGLGLDNLREHLKQVMGYKGATEGSFMARRRHLEALQYALEHTQLAKQQLVEFNAGELVAEELRVAQQALNEITGEFSSDDLLGCIFSSFCIGK